MRRNLIQVLALRNLAAHFRADKASVALFGQAIGCRSFFLSPGFDGVITYRSLSALASAEINFWFTCRRKRLAVPADGRWRKASGLMAASKRMVGCSAVSRAERLQIAPIADLGF
jgi:hypothetical protein